YGTRSVGSRVTNVGENSLEVVGVKVSTAHLDDRTEAAVERTAPRRLDDIDLSANHGVAREDTGASVGRANFVGAQSRDWPVRIVHERPAAAIGEARDAIV